jgi:starch phosphorylase
MEIALENRIPTYSGGLGVLAGDTILSAADLRLPMVAVSLVHRKGYFKQKIDKSGKQSEEPVKWNLEEFLEPLSERATVEVEGAPVTVRAWKYNARGRDGHVVPVYLLDTDLPENGAYHRTLTDSLYGGDERYRLCQETVLGIGGVRMLRALGYRDIERFHMNEGHSALLTLEILRERCKDLNLACMTDDNLADVREHCVFTTHTPVAAGHDKFPLDLVEKVTGISIDFLKGHRDFSLNGELNLTYLALSLSQYVNGVARRHGEVSRLMFAGYKIHAITNGVHAGRWVSPPMGELLDKHIPEWREDNFSLRSALMIPREEIWGAHMEAKRAFIDDVNDRAGADLVADALTLGFARRATAYKRGGLLISDLAQLKSIAKNVGALQIVYAGKAHPRDKAGKDIIREVFKAREALGENVKIAYVPNYDMATGALMTAGVDVWVNTPQPPMEASGTSGMKAALNGVPSLSILDGWWIEGHLEGITGWAIGQPVSADHAEADSEADAKSLYDKLERVVAPTYYHDRNGWVDIMRHAIALNGSFFNTQRMVQEYVVDAYFS